MEQLPVEVVRIILALLPLADLHRLRSVSRKMRALVDGAPHLLATLHLPPFADRITDAVLLSLVMRSGRMAQSLSLASPILTNDGFLRALKHCPQLVELTLTNCRQLSGSIIAPLIMACPRLRALHVISCPRIQVDHLAPLRQNREIRSFTFEPTDGKHIRCCSADFQLILQPDIVTVLRLKTLGICSHMVVSLANFSELQELQLGGNPQVTDASMALVLASCRNLTRLDVSGTACGNETMVNIANSPAARSGSLRHLNCSDCTVNNSNVSMLIKALPELRSAELSNCNITGQVVRALAGCEKLQVVDLSGIDELLDDHIFHLGSYCRQLQHVDFSGTEVTGDGMAAFVELVGLGLRSLNLTDCENVDDKFFAAVSKHAWKVNAIGVSGENEVTDAGAFLLSNCVDLEDIDFSGNKQITDRSILAIAERCTKLNTFKMYECSNLTDTALCAIFTHCKGLNIVHIGGTQATDTAVSLLAHVPLKRLWVRGCPITDLSVMELALHCHLLANINLAHCLKISDSSLLALANHCHNISFIGVAGCPLVTREAVEAARQLCVVDL